MGQMERLHRGTEQPPSQALAGRRRAVRRAGTTGASPAGAADAVALAFRTGAGLLDLQRRVGNRSVASGIAVQRRRRRREPTPEENIASFVTKAVADGRIADQQVPMPAGVHGPPAPGGAFWMLNGLNPAELVQVLGHCSTAVRRALLDRIAEADGRFDRPRLESALRSAAWSEKRSGVAGLTLMDAIRSAGTGAFAPVWASLAGQSRVSLAATLRTLDRATLLTLQGRLPEAAAANRPRLTDVIVDLLGTGTNMQAADVVDVSGLRGLDRAMAQIYNFRGQLILEKATDLGISTHAAAGIMKAESGGATFHQATNKTIIRFENHVFWREWGSANAAVFRQHFQFHSPGHNWEGHRFREDPTGAWETFHGNQEDEWRVITFAARLSGEEPAFRSASWGAGQIMGFNATTVGFATAVDMAASFNAAERPQVSSIFEFIRANHLEAAVRANDYLTLATRYNGGGQAAHYAANIQNNATAYQRVTAGKRHVIP